MKHGPVPKLQWLRAADPLADARKRREQYLQARALIDAASQPDAYDRLSAQIKFEEDLMASFTEFKNERAAKRRGPMSLSAKGILQLLGMAVLWLVVIGIWRRYFG